MPSGVAYRKRSGGALFAEADIAKRDRKVAVITAGAVGGAPAKLFSQVPLERAGHSGDVASAALFLRPAEPAFITGMDLFIAGGSVSR